MNGDVSCLPKIHVFTSSAECLHKGALWAGDVFPSLSCISLGRCDGVLDSRIWMEVM